MRELWKDVCSAAFFFESADKAYKIVGSFAETSPVSNAYRGELLGLMALHLILLAVNKINPNMQGSITLHSDYLGALSRARDLPPGKVPSQCKHADILKNILLACDNLSFSRRYEHIEAHQDDSAAFASLSRPAQLNCAVDAGAKRRLWAAIEDGECTQRAFPLEPIVCFADKCKITPDMKGYAHFWLQRKLARDALSDMKILRRAQFDEIDWKYVHGALESVPRMFQIWACKQVLDIANTNGTVHRWDKSVDPLCPSCGQVVESTEHILLCSEAGRVATFMQTVTLLDGWLRRMDTEPTLRDCILRYCRGRGYISMGEICRGYAY